MPILTLRAQAIGPLERVEWTIPDGVSAIVGPNRVGKSTLLALPTFLRFAIQDGLNNAVAEVFDGPSYFRNFGAPGSLTSSIGLTFLHASWDVQLSFAGGALASYCAEQLRNGDGSILERALGADHGAIDGRNVPLGAQVIPRVCSDRLAVAARKINPSVIPGTSEERNTSGTAELEQSIAPLNRLIAAAGALLAHTASKFLSFRTYEYQITHLLRYGSRQSSDQVLLGTGENIFPLLRNWRDDSDTEPRFNFVLDTLREAFPHVKRVDFEQAGQSVTMAIRDARWAERKLPISRESTGLVTALLQLCAVASCPQGGLVTLDEPETSLHPRAIQVLVEAFRRLARDQEIQVVLATQSETVLDQFHDCPEQIQVLEPNQETSPRSLTDMFGADWLSQFSLGDLFAHLEFGSNRERPAGP